MTPTDHRYWYRADIYSLYDADTVTMLIYTGFGEIIGDKESIIHGGYPEDADIRLAHINAPEVSGKERPAGLASREYAAQLINGGTGSGIIQRGRHLYFPSPKRVMIKTLVNKRGRDLRGKFGRYVAEIYLRPADGSENWLYLNKALVDARHAVWQEY